MKLTFKDNYFKKGSLYRLEAIRKIRKDDLFKFLTVNFIKLQDSRQLNEFKKLSAKKDYDTYFDFMGYDLYARSIILDVEIEYLYILSPGSIWKATSSKTIKKVFEPKEAETIELGDEREDTSYKEMINELDESAQFKFLKNNNNLSLLCIPNSTFKGESVTVLIPHSEIVRHYFAASKYFIRRLFSEDLIAELATLIGNIEDNKDICSIKLNSRHFLDSDVPFLARGLLDDEAMNAMREVHSHAYRYLKKSKIGGYYDNVTELPLTTNLPFVDGSKLEVIGHYVSKEDSIHKYFLIRKIQTCHHSWPFNKLEIISAETFPDRDREEYKVKIPKEQSSVEQEDIELMIDSPPNAEEIELKIDVHQEGRFPFLDELPVKKKQEKGDKEELIFNAVGITQTERIQENYDTNQGSSGEEKYSQSNTTNPVQLEHNKDATEIKSFTDISMTFSEIELEQDDWRITALPTNRINAAEPYGEFSFKGTKWSMISSKNRRGLLLKIEIIDDIDNFTVYCLDIEPKEGRTYGLYLFTSPKYALSISETELEKIIDKISKNKGKGIGKILKSKFEIVNRLNHTSVNESIKDRIVNKIYEMTKSF
ncbi:hypothetical protein [Psychrobacter immobilis]|uniref:hypothetical protein n=1 Tax=Psychrobacter immobilis TaxID=498 RepID=UPI00191929A5|nr:hypothetical protein [Psychrobacter immobilis]